MVYVHPMQTRSNARLNSSVINMLTSGVGSLKGLSHTLESYLAKGLVYMTSPSGKYAMIRA